MSDPVNTWLRSVALLAPHTADATLSVAIPTQHGQYILNLRTALSQTCRLQSDLIELVHIGQYLFSVF